MDVRVKLNQATKLPTPKQEILTGLPQSSVRNLLDILGSRHPELAPMFKQAKEARDLRVYVNNDEVPSTEAPRYMLRDGDTVSLFLKPHK